MNGNHIPSEHEWLGMRLDEWLGMRLDEWLVDDDEQNE